MKSFKPTDYYFLLLCVTKYDFLADSQKVDAAAKAFFEHQAKNFRIKVLPVKKQKEMNMSPEEVKNAKATIDKEIEDQRASITDAYEQQLKQTRPLNDLPACREDAIVYLVYMMKDIGCPPHKITVMAEEDEFNEIWAGALKQMGNTKSKDNASLRDFPHGSKDTGAKAVDENLAVPVKA